MEDAGAGEGLGRGGRRLEGDVDWRRHTDGYRLCLSLQRLERLAGRPRVVVEHDLPLILAITDHVYCLEAGAVITHGAPD